MQKDEPHLVEISLPEYKADEKPNSLDTGQKLDDLLKRYFMGKNIVLRCIGSRDHAGKTIDELARIIAQTGTDKYDPERKGQGYEVAHNLGKRIDFFGTEVTVKPDTNVFAMEILRDFYYEAQGDRGYPIRIDIVIVYDAANLAKVEHLYGEDIDESDGYTFNDPTHKQNALLGLIKIL